MYFYSIIDKKKISNYFLAVSLKAAYPQTTLQIMHVDKANVEKTVQYCKIVNISLNFQVNVKKLYPTFIYLVETNEKGIKIRNKIVKVRVSSISILNCECENYYAEINEHSLFYMWIHAIIRLFNPFKHVSTGVKVHGTVEKHSKIINK